MISKTSFFVILLIGFIGFIGGRVKCATTREPSIQAYGLPKRFFASSGFIERVYGGHGVDDESPETFPAKVDGYPGDPSNVRNKFAVNAGPEDGTIEIVHGDSVDSDEIRTKFVSRNRRAVEAEKTSSDDEDMQTEESKVFRPLFVYRQQVAKRQRLQKEKQIARDNKSRYNYNNKNSIQYYPQSG